MFRLIHLLAPLLLVLLVSGCASIANEAPYQVSSERSQGWDMRQHGLKWKLTVPADPGIGQLTVKPLALKPSPDLMIHLPLTNLEQVKVSYADRQMTAGFSRSGYIHDSQCDSCSDNQAVTLRLVVIARKDATGAPDGYDLYLPSDYWKSGAGPVSIQWVDWFRS